ncbi:2-polyprenyl-3-methyl-5-hydroxy-6-metoxy-1,4-benzoquinol methylase [Kribbella aluminosa]|uniref:2-polyprenyl-3-methyl-5-hydroxy-6-metoxy-1, 4-benzoquinol methylase n=1 Tax=Kribbella aluminosa TaxID=416017 RepID=A0ABS4UQA3_9ACTN|nr:class I SAM-dependent methyltransferase [Kribbella aluminosa]MBP2353817.1 2-polyprenyl-3-methyl-5-hydroxy-6-metoxy-1,4-benzoquinol methylase [Kribbella aluminosa]
MLHDITESNRASWNQIHHARPGEPASYFAAGGSTLTEAELAAAGNVRGRRVLQLACSCGDEVLSWARLGASVTGVDISEVALAMAIEKSAAAGISADFVRADMLALPESLTGFDLIYLSWGAVCWLPDLDVFATSVAARLIAGGSVLIAEHHPAWETLAVRGPSQLEVTADYFGRTTPLAAVENSKRPTGARDNPDAPSFTAFIWPPSDVITALLKAGLTLTRFEEAPDPDSYLGLGPAASALPATYLIRATRNVPRET